VPHVAFAPPALAFTALAVPFATALGLYLVLAVAFVQLTAACWRAHVVSASPHVTFSTAHILRERLMDEMLHSMSHSHDSLSHALDSMSDSLD
jgi:hypothetical protein